MTVDTALTVRRATSNDREAVLTLLAAALGWRADEGLPGFFDWKHHENPFGESPAWVAVAGERVAGFRTFLRWEFVDASGALRRAVRAVDTATHPEYQGRGIFRALTLAAVEEMTAEGIDFVFNTPNDKSRPGYLKMGWHEVGRLPAAARVANVQGALRMIRSRVPAARWPSAGASGDAAADVLADERVPVLLQQLGAPRGLQTRRSAAHLRWRYGYAPLGYRALVAGGDPANGIAVFRVRQRGHAREAALCELLVPEGDHATALGLGRDVARASQADYVIRLGPGDRSGFVPLPALGPILTWRALATRDAAPSLRSWQLSLGDVELL